MTDYEVIIRRARGLDIKVVLEVHDAADAEARYEALRSAIEEGQRVDAPAVELRALGSGLAVDPGEVTGVDLIDASEGPSPGHCGPTLDRGEI